MTDNAVADHIAFLEDPHDAAALLPFRGGNLLDGVHIIGVKRLAKGFNLGDVEGLKGLFCLIQRHHHALFIVFIAAFGVGGHIQRVKNGKDLGYGVGNAVVEFLVGFPCAALAEVVILRSGAQELFLKLIVFLLCRVQLCLDGVQLLGFLAEPFFLFLIGLGLSGLIFGGFRLLFGGFGFCLGRLRFGSGLRFPVGHCLLFCFFAHVCSSSFLPDMHCPSLIAK